ncbi:transcription repressor NadR [Dubosiella muris]|uniref:Transcription repressor NadR n=2 Tax=Dubosiella TaxID=1937008 RepID=A0AC61RBE4_9FIRM|nr:transcription repressor NadR [Dubosiella muris]TGY66904.1 transcription repressor NadR [Dubosiella muris]
MKTKERRDAIIEILKKSEVPVPAKSLASRFNVSRQAIVQDLTVIRAYTSGIASTPKGYVMIKDQGHAFQKEFKMYHESDQTEQELFLIVDHGGKVKNVSISHRVYGRISVDLDIRSRQDARDFMEAFQGSKSKYLGEVTSGYHYHLVEADNEQRLKLIEQKLMEAGLLAPLSPWEKEESGMEEA